MHMPLFPRPSALPQPTYFLASALGVAALISMQAEAAAVASPEALLPLPAALFAFGRGAAVFFLAPAALAAVVWHRPILAAARRLWPRLAATLGPYLPKLPERPRHEVQAPAPDTSPAGLAATLAADAKARMTSVHRTLRQIAPELLLPFAEYRAVQNRLIAAAAEAGAAPLPAGACAHQLILSGLMQIEAATGKLSVVLGDATKEYALGSYADTLERLTGEAMDCLCGLRAAAKREAPPEVQLGDKAA